MSIKPTPLSQLLSNLQPEKRSTHKIQGREIQGKAQAQANVVNQSNRHEASRFNTTQEVHKVQPPLYRQQSIDGLIIHQAQAPAIRTFNDIAAQEEEPGYIIDTYA